MRVTLLTPEFSTFGGGITTFYRQLSGPLSELGVTIRVVEGSAFHAGERAARMVDGVAVETLEQDRLFRWWERFAQYGATPGIRRHLAAAWAMWEQAGRGEDADVVEAADWGMLFVPPAVEASTPLIVQGHGSIGQIAMHDPVVSEATNETLCRLLEDGVLRRAQGLQTSTAANAAFWRSQLQRDSQIIRPAWALPPAVDPGALTDRGLVVGRVQAWKGPDVVCRALALMGLKAPAIDWIGRDIAPSPRSQPYSASLRAAFPDIWGKRILHHDQMPPEAVWRRQGQALFNLAPSTWDVFNFTAIEAMASGRPTIVSSGAGMSELIVDGENGFVFPNRDAEALAARIDRVLGAGPEALARIGAAGRDTIRRELNPNTVAQARLAAYRTAISQFESCPPQPIQGWLGTACRPSDGRAPPGLAFLEGFPMRGIAGHLAGRLGGKLGWRAGSRGPGE